MLPRCRSCSTSHSLLGAPQIDADQAFDLGGVHAGCTEVIGGWVVAAHPLCSVTGCCAMQLRSLERGTCWCWVWGR